ncbi:MAG: Asp-tRNA(Asn)/Glu-tRNA(Gln) amidotransferase subunit GatC [Deltaproteobacteria bacterium]
MKIDKAEVTHVANLARLEFSEEEKDKFTHQLNNILSYMEKLNQVDTDGIAPTTHAVELQNAFREDIVKPSLSNEMVMANAPDKAGDCFRVPKVIE